MLTVFISSLIIYVVILLLVALGGMFSERSGVINIALEGIMIIGGLAGAIAFALLPSDMNGIVRSILAMVIAALAGGIFSLLLSFAAITMKADQTIGGTAINVLATSLAVVLAKQFNGMTGDYFTNSNIDMDRTGFFFTILGVQVNYFFPIAIIVLIISTIVLYKTSFGLQLRACGENPGAADSVGINVIKYRYLGTTISGVLAGLGGAAYVLVVASRWNSSSGVNGFGFLALAVMIFGQWKPIRIFFAAVFFSLFKTLSVVYSSIPLLNNLGFSSNIYKMMPFVACLIILTISSKNSRAPKAEGIPYDKGQR